MKEGKFGSKVDVVEWDFVYDGFSFEMVSKWKDLENR